LIAQMAQRGYAMNKGRIVATLTEATLANREALIEHLSI
jgi:ABC-type branched-subunit amino acid transport system ATPase component